MTWLQRWGSKMLRTSTLTDEEKLSILRDDIITALDEWREGMLPSSDELPWCRAWWRDLYIRAGVFSEEEVRRDVGILTTLSTHRTSQHR